MPHGQDEQETQEAEQKTEIVDCAIVVKGVTITPARLRFLLLAIRRALVSGIKLCDETLKGLKTE